MKERTYPAIVDEYNHRFAYADAFRATAIAGVVLTHIFPVINLKGHLIPIASFGGLCVNIFFVLSGYLLSKPFMKSIVGQCEFPHIGIFFKKRFLRIYPTYFAAVLLSMIGVSYDHANIVSFFVSHATFFHGFMNSEIISRNAPLWTMAVDVQYYLALPILSLVLFKLAKGVPKVHRAGYLAILLLGTIPMSLLWRAFMIKDLPAFSMDEKIVSLYDVALHNIIGVGSSFAIGALIALGEIEKIKFSAAAKYWLLAIAFVLLCIDVPLLTKYVALPINGYIGDLIGSSISGIFFLVLSLGSSKRINEIVSSKATKIVAELAYSIYLIHWMCLWWVRDAIGPMLHLTTITERVLLTMSLTTVLSLSLNLFVERPFLRMKNAISVAIK